MSSPRVADGAGHRAQHPAVVLTPAAAGLSTEEAARRLRDVGPNEPVPARRRHALVAILGLLANPLLLILLAASAASVLLGDVTNATIITLMVVLSVVLNFVQSERSARAAERLREDVAPRATVLRDGAWAELPRREVVPGDVVRIGAGDHVPADACLLQTRELHVQQAALTGESLPAEKEAAGGATAPVTSPTARHMVFYGTSVVSGTGVAGVVATGAATAFGDVAARLAERPPETEFERGSRRFALFITRTVLFLVLFVMLASVALHRPPLQSLLFAVALAVGLTPEFLPMITTVTLAQGAIRMARRKVIVRHLAAIEDFGSMDVLCSDKTGTLTTGEMAVEASLDPGGAPSPRAFAVAALNSAHESGIRSPLDAAILRHGPSDAASWTKVDEIPFDFERRRLSVVLERDNERWLVTKGAPEAIVELCVAAEGNGVPRPLDAAARSGCRAVYERLSAEGYRVLAVANRRLPSRAAYSRADERDLVLIGFVVFGDPLVEGVAAAIETLRRDGVAVKILTGDSELVARHVCGRVGLDAGRIISGDELERMSASALAAVVESTSVFARVSPAQKHRVILALKSRDHVVGFLGDGINDAPSLHAADVGISVANAVDVAKDAADLILRDRNLAVLHAGILEGRRAFTNVMKYLLMGTSSNFGNMFSMAAATLFLPFLPMLPTQILLNNFLYDLAQITIPTDAVDVGAVGQPRRWDLGLIQRFMVVIGPISSLYDFATFGVLLGVFHASEPLFHTGWFVESLATQTLVLFVIRTAGNPLRSRPSRALAATTIAVVLIGCLLPVSPLASTLGFVPLPVAFWGFLVAMTLSYLLFVELVKRRLLRPPARP